MLLCVFTRQGKRNFIPAHRILYCSAAIWRKMRKWQIIFCCVAFTTSISRLFLPATEVSQYLFGNRVTFVSYHFEIANNNGGLFILLCAPCFYGLFIFSVRDSHNQQQFTLNCQHLFNKCVQSRCSVENWENLGNCSKIFQVAFVASRRVQFMTTGK